MTEYSLFPSICIKTNIIFVPDSGKLCRLPYPDHKYGCPNYGKKAICPPRAKKIKDGKYVVLATKFDLKKWKKRMWELHPNWTERQASCCLYWQGKARKELKKWISACGFSDSLIKNPEAKGVDVSKTMKSLGYPLQWPPKEYVWTVALAKEK